MPHADECPFCELSYDEFRTGMTFADVKASMRSESSDPSTWRHRTRRMVLGCWHAMKVALFSSHIAECQWTDACRREYESEVA